MKNRMKENELESVVSLPVPQKKIHGMIDAILMAYFHCDWRMSFIVFISNLLIVHLIVDFTTISFSIDSFWRNDFVFDLPSGGVVTMIWQRKRFTLWKTKRDLPSIERNDLLYIFVLKVPIELCAFHWKHFQ